jgi:hypothetical protein
MSEVVITPPHLYLQWLQQDPIAWSHDEQSDLVALHGVAPQLAQQAAGLPSYAGAYGGEWRTIDAIDSAAARENPNIRPSDIPEILGGYQETGYWRGKLQLALDRRFEWLQTAGESNPAAVAEQKAKADELIAQWQATRPGGAGATAAAAVHAQDQKASTDWAALVKAGLTVWALASILKLMK